MEAWYLRREEGTVEGPFPEREIAEDLISGRIRDTEFVRQGAQGNWCEASRARTVFRQLAEQGWYIRTDGELFGPFTEMRLLELHRHDGIAPGSDLRKGLDGPWRPAQSILALAANEKVDDSADNDVSSEIDDSAGPPKKWTIEPIRHIIVPLQLADTTAFSECLHLERLLLQASDDARLVTARRLNGQEIGFLSENNSQQVFENSARGLSHIALLYSSPVEKQVEIALVLCPPGISAEACRQYIDEQFSSLRENL